MKSTALLERHVAAGARLVDFAGWRMPVQYRGILDEHRAVRTACGVFDISHMGEFLVSGPGAAAWLDSLCTASVGALAPGTACYTLLLNERGGVIDDLLAYRLGACEFLLVVNASRTDEDAAWLRAHLGGEVTFRDVSALFSVLAVQGPGAPAVFAEVFGVALPAGRNRIVPLPGQDGEAWAATTGYTGEAGCEAICRNEQAGGWWDRFLAAGCVPCGLGARDVLRLEMGYPLNGADLSPDRTPLEAGLGFAVDMEKPAFIGRDALVAQRAEGVAVKLIGLRLDAPSPPLRAHYAVFHDGGQVGETTSGGLSPSLGAPIAMAYLPARLAPPGTAVEIEIRGQLHPAKTVRRPFLSTAAPAAASSLS